MIKTLIVEDDIFDYSHLKNMISWEKEGFMLYDGAKNGTEAIEIINNNPLDLIITDMSMPGMDGLEVIKYIKENYPDIKTLAISGYDDFLYVKESLKMGAGDYILKHNLTPELLKNTLNFLKNKIIEEKQIHLEKEKLEREIKTGRHILVQNFINRLVKEGIESKKELKEELDSLGIQLYFQKIVVVAAQLDDYDFFKEKYLESEIKDLKKSFTNMVDEIFKDMTEAVMSFLEDGKFVILFSFENQNSEQEIFNQVTTTVNRIRSTIKQNFNLTVCFAITDICGDIRKINKYYKKAEQILKKKFYQGKNKIFYDTSENQIKNNFNFLGVQEERKLLEAIKEVNQGLMISYINDIFDKILKSQPSIESVKLTIISFVNIVNKLVKEYLIEMEDIYRCKGNPYEQLSKYDTIQELKKWIIDIYINLLNILQDKGITQQYSGVTGKAIDFINKNFRKDINLNIVANKVGVNSSYLSRKFKKDCGKGFVEYLNNLRIEQAKSLIANTNCQIKEIVPEVGFNNYNYFFKVFKDSQGMTPVEYEEYIRSIQD